MAGSYFAGAHAETINCTAITSLPYVITTQGVYCLTGDLVTDMMAGSAIDIQTNNVTIDLNGHKLGGGPAGLGTSTWGIRAADRNNITIKNGTIRGFLYGVGLTDSSIGHVASGGHMIEDLRLDGNTVSGVHLEGSGNTVRNNRIANTGGSTVSADSHGITTYGPAAQILNNSVISTKGSASGAGVLIGIFVPQGNGDVIQNNRIINVDKLDWSVGIQLSPGVTATTIRDNHIQNMLIGVAVLGANLSGVCTGNVVVGTNTVSGAYLGCAFSGTNYP
jgi:parallel beta-helix repeat protein